MANLEIPVKETWAIFKNGDKIECKQIHHDDRYYFHFNVDSKEHFMAAIPKKDIIAKGTYKNLLKKYPEYMI